MENYQSIVHSPTNLLLCKEIATSLDDEDEAASIFEDFYEDDYIKLLLDRESTTNGGLLQMQQQNSWILRARLDAIHYILTKREVLGFRYQTAYTSVTFLDRFLSRRSIDVEKSWAIRLLSIACLSLAAKMEETTLPALSDLCADDYKFESSVIQRMELLVLNTLEWEMGSITPFSFVQFFAEKFRNRTKIGLSRTAHITLATIR
ncbi:PREDICTED: cyclin-D5-3-like, partial [Erythranthe guttata]|uniref:cyclin-D5-3-like n=1 Tax=Erythranthe guttata TaxID=4155 RepID=UPI00064D8042